MCWRYTCTAVVITLYFCIACALWGHISYVLQYIEFIWAKTGAMSIWTVWTYLYVYFCQFIIHSNGVLVVYQKLWHSSMQWAMGIKHMGVRYFGMSHDKKHWKKIILLNQNYILINMKRQYFQHQYLAKASMYTRLSLCKVDPIRRLRKLSHTLDLATSGSAFDISSHFTWEWYPITHWGRNKMAAISKKTFSNQFYWIKMYEFFLKFHWNLFLSVRLTIFQHWFKWWLRAGQATSHYLNQWELYYRRMYASRGLSESIKEQLYICNVFALWLRTFSRDMHHQTQLKTVSLWLWDCSGLFRFHTLQVTDISRPDIPWRPRFHPSEMYKGKVLAHEHLQ